MGFTQERDVNRDNEIVEMFKCGVKYPEISEKYGITKQRVGQILKRNSVKASDRYNYKTKEQKERERMLDSIERMKIREDKHISRTGYSIAEYEKIRKNVNNQGFTPQQAYKRQRKNSKIRKIEWKFNFRSWWEIWRDSGKWDERGRRANSYVMGRVDDMGPYSPDNVIIQTSSSNISDGYAYRRKVLNKNGLSD